MNEEEDESNYILGENIYKLIEKITTYSDEAITISTNLLSQISNLFESIEDEVTSEIINEAGSINDFISKIYSFTKNELQEIKIKSKIAIENAEKRRVKIYKLKEENNKLKQKVKEEKYEKEQLISNIDNISSQLNELYQENIRIKQKSNMELINKNQDKILKEKYINQINNMQNDLNNLKEKNKNIEKNMNKYHRMSVILQEKNQKLNSELGAQSMQFINTIKEQKNQKNIINSLRSQNNELCEKIKFYQSQIDIWQVKYKTLEEEKNNFYNTHQNFYTKIPEMPESINKSSEKNVRRKSGKKLSRLRSKKYEKSESEDDSEKNFKYKTYSNLNDLLENESDKSMDKSSSKESDSFCVNKPPSNFDQDYFFEINLNTYENFFI